MSQMDDFPRSSNAVSPSSSTFGNPNPAVPYSLAPVEGYSTIPLIQQPVPGNGYPSPTTGIPENQTPPNPDGKERPLGAPYCTPGLEYLGMMNHLYIHEELDVDELILGDESVKKLHIKDSSGQVLYTAIEENDCCTRNFCGPCRTFGMTIKDNSGREVIYFHRPCRCDACCCPCCLQELQVMSPPGTVIGRVTQQWSPCANHFALRDATGEIVLRLRGPFPMCDPIFKVLCKDRKTQVGFIQKHKDRQCEDANLYELEFPEDLDVNAKVLLLAGAVLIDFMFFGMKKKGPARLRL